MVGCLLVAGGQGTRLGHSGPKGTFVLPEIGKSLFELFVEKIPDPSAPIAIMTSPLNHQETVDYFKRFDLKNLRFFQQKMLPMRDQQGEVVGEGPDGNGHALKYFWESGIGAEWERQRVELISFVVVDNLLADPFDEKLLSCARETGADVVVKCVEALGREEKVGRIVKEGGKVRVIEYSELPEGDFPLANISLFSFRMDFSKQVAAVDLPLHVHEKQGLLKSERFIFDVLPYAEKVEILLCKREETFAPLKNRNGVDSIATALEQLRRSS